MTLPFAVPRVIQIVVSRMGLRELTVMAALLLSSGQTHALDEFNTTFFGGLAVEGYDTVAYFTEHRAVKGSKDFQLQWRGANWRFSSEENLDAFRSNPTAYAPQYGGYCAWAVSQNDTAGIDPTQFTVHDGKLYLNYNQKISTRWRANMDGFIADADRYWPQLLSD